MSSSETIMTSKKILPNIIIPNSAGVGVGGLKSRIISLSKWWNIMKQQQQSIPTTTTTNNNNDHLLLPRPRKSSTSSSSSQLQILRLMDMRSSESYNNKERHHHLMMLCTNNNKNQQQQQKQFKFVAATLPVDVIKERSFELPTRNVEFSIFVHPSNLDRAEEFLIGEKDRKGRKRPFKPWTIKHVLLDDDDFWMDAKNLGLVVDDDTKDTTSKEIFPYPRLWQPDPMVENILLPILKKELEEEEEEEEEGCTTGGGGGGQIWDLGSGAGRDLVFLAEELLSSSQQRRQQEHQQQQTKISSSSPSSSSSLPYKLVGLDHRYNEKETRITMDFCSRRGVSQITSCKKLDCSKWDIIKDELIQSQQQKQKQKHGTTKNNNNNYVKAMYAVRFWKPSLFHELAICDDNNNDDDDDDDDQQNNNIICPPGMIVAMSNFCKPYEGSSWDYTNPNENIVLERNQLYDLFTKEDKWHIIHDEIVIEPDHGRPMIHFVAKRK